MAINVNITTRINATVTVRKHSQKAGYIGKELLVSISTKCIVLITTRIRAHLTRTNRRQLA